jgi:hypothetical protein
MKVWWRRSLKKENDFQVVVRNIRSNLCNYLQAKKSRGECDVARVSPAGFMMHGPV